MALVVLAADVSMLALAELATEVSMGSALAVLAADVAMLALAEPADTGPMA